MTVAFDVGPEPTPIVVSQCSCGRPYTDESWKELQLATSATHDNGRLQHDGETYEFRVCACGTTLATKL